MTPAELSRAKEICEQSTAGFWYVDEQGRVRPDIDNYQKAILDSFNGIFWHDDSQVCEVEAKKFYDWTSNKGSIAIRIYEHEELGVK